MGAGAHWRPAGRSRVPAHRAGWRTGFCHRQRCWERVLRRIYSSLWGAIFGFLFLLLVCFIYLPDPFSSPLEEESVTLLIWTHPFREYRELPDCWELYQITGCTLTDDDRAYPEADAVILHHREIATLKVDLPPEPRPRAQKWIWLNYESPSHTPRLWLFEGLFNLTMSYRTDSDVFLPYGYLVPRERTDTGPQSRFTHPLRGPSHSDFRRPRLVAWVVSNWSESHARVSLYYELRRFVQIDVFGRAGRPLSKGSDSVVQLLRRYLFYLALENSLHTDYITEKLWNAVLAGAVPVVLGPPRKNYEHFLPPEAFIHVDDFATVQELARYLLMLRSNPGLMRRHLDWRGRYSVHRPVFWGEHFCKACEEVRSVCGAALPPLVTFVLCLLSYKQTRAEMISLEPTFENTILNAFKVFDPEGTGVLGREEGVMKYHLMSQADKFTEDEVNQMFANSPLDATSNLDNKNLCCVITHGEDKEQE